MLAIQFVRDHAEEVQRVADAKGLRVSVPEVLALDGERRQLLHHVEALRAARNRASAEIAQLLRAGEHAEAGRRQEMVRAQNRELAEWQSNLATVTQRYDTLMEQLPNIISPDTPYGASDADNVELRRVGVIPEFDFTPQNHVTLAETMGMLDLARGVKVAGARAYFLKNAGLHLHRAVQQLAVDVLSARGFSVMDVPLLVREEAMKGTGFFPGGRDQTYELPEDRVWLAGTAEVPLVSYYADEIVDVTEPIRLAAVSNCFRREAGSAGRDVRGLYRVHQFAKVEQVVLCEANLETSLRLFAEITQVAEDILALLELPYRVVSVCTGDLSQKNYKQYDIETWMPSRQAYGETHSSSMLLDFQARRSRIRYRDAKGDLHFCHTLNNTAVATPRILIPLLENHQRADGSVHIPQALRPYLRGLEELRV